MKVVKLDAINSTNNYLKMVSKDVKTVNWTVVTAEHQTLGRGQMDTIWDSEKGKNLVCSILIQFKTLKSLDQFYLNCAVSLGIYGALDKYDIPNLKVKWPNDIMSGSKKVCGILIENTLVNDRISNTVIGIGLNVNQENFSNDLPKAISMKQILGIHFNRDEILESLVACIQEQIEFLQQKDFKLLHANYEKVLFQHGEIHVFENKQQKKFMGKILGVTDKGCLLVEQENDVINEYNFKEIIFLN
jgi:BirA family biotin operon repressor/biotin-[acetyl-CoA-carboxylase] ligase